MLQCTRLRARLLQGDSNADDGDDGDYDDGDEDGDDLFSLAASKRALHKNRYVQP